MINKLIYFTTLFALIGCNDKQIIHLYNGDKSNCITAITIDTIRYVIPYKTTELPKDNHLKVDIGGIDPLGDGIWICWLDSNKWNMVIHNSKILANSLNPNKYVFHTRLPEDNRGLPHQKKFTEPHCAVFDFYSMTLLPANKTTVEIK